MTILDYCTRCARHGHNVAQHDTDPLLMAFDAVAAKAHVCKGRRAAQVLALIATHGGDLRLPTYLVEYMRLALEPFNVQQLLDEVRAENIAILGPPDKA